MYSTEYCTVAVIFWLCIVKHAHVTRVPYRSWRVLTPRNNVWQFPCLSVRKAAMQVGFSNAIAAEASSVEPPLYLLFFLLQRTYCIVPRANSCLERRPKYGHGSKKRSQTIRWQNSHRWYRRHWWVRQAKQRRKRVVHGTIQGCIVLPAILPMFEMSEEITSKNLRPSLVTRHRLMCEQEQQGQDPEITMFRQPRSQTGIKGSNLSL
jgi:hypothetical protein